MHHSLTTNQRLFLRINHSIGAHPWFDTLMIFSARWLIYLLGAFLAITTAVLLRDHAIPTFLGMARIVVLALLLNWFIGFLFRRPRPQVELDHVRVLVQPKQTFKAFPSDHTTIAVIFAIIGTVLAREVSSLFAVLYIISALLISISRVYVGVHYPRDIVGGFLFGIVYIMLFWGFL